VGALASPSEVLVATTVKDLVVGSGIEFTDRGEHELKGVPGTWKAVVSQELTDAIDLLRTALRMSSGTAERSRIKSSALLDCRFGYFSRAAFRFFT
jgi:hypothetical protein